jgi:hypothetical protein
MVQGDEAVSSTGINCLHHDIAPEECNVLAQNSAFDVPAWGATGNCLLSPYVGGRNVTNVAVGELEYIKITTVFNSDSILLTKPTYIF